MNTLYLRIKELANGRKESLAEIERNLKFSNGIISTWKNGNASSDKLEKVADYFGVSADYLLGRTDNPKIANINTGTTDMAAHFRDGVTNLTPEQIEELDKLTNTIIEGYIAKNKKDK